MIFLLFLFLSFSFLSLLHLFSILIPASSLPRVFFLWVSEKVSSGLLFVLFDAIFFSLFYPSISLSHSPSLGLGNYVYVATK